MSTSGPKLPTYFLIILELMFCILLYILYRCLHRYRCNQQTLDHSISHTTTYTSLIPYPSQGLNISTIDKLLPTFLYKDIKHQVLIDVDHNDDEQYSHGEVELILECAVCFIPFEDDDILRLIPICEHVFHCKCIDPWFKSHSTCPYCRLDLSQVEFSDSEESQTISEEDSGSDGRIVKKGSDSAVIDVGDGVGAKSDRC